MDGIWEFFGTSNQEGSKQVGQLFSTGGFEDVAGLIEIVPLHLAFQINDLVPHRLHHHPESQPGSRGLVPGD